jgi:hypothetical protein
MEYYIYTIYDKRDNSFVCCGVNDTMDGAERTAREILKCLKHKKHYAIAVMKGE